MKTSRRGFLRFLPAAAAVAVAAPALAKALPKRRVIRGPFPSPTCVPWANRKVIRTGLPVAQWRKLNTGVQPIGLCHNKILADMKWTGE